MLAVNPIDTLFMYRTICSAFAFLNKVAVGKLGGCWLATAMPKTTVRQSNTAQVPMSGNVPWTSVLVQIQPVRLQVFCVWS